MTDSSRIWRKCSSCKKDILLGQIYQICSVSTCQAKRTNYTFCSVSCWDAHVPIERHRGDSASAIERRAPLHQAPTEAEAPATKRTIVASSTAQDSSDDSSNEILIVVSKTKKYISDRSGMNTSADVFKVLTQKVQRLCDNAIEEARRSGRKTVLERDFK